MHIIQLGLPALRPGEPSPAALHREEFLNEKPAVKPAKVVDHRAQQRVRLLRAGVTSRVGSYFA